MFNNTRQNKIGLSLLIILLCSSVLTPTLFYRDTPRAYASWESGYGYRKKVTLQENNGSALTDYQVNFTLDYSSSSDSGYTIGMDSKCQTDFGDIRFTGSDGETDLDYWLETTHTGDNATVWVEVPSLSASSTTDIYLYCGTDASSSTTSNATETMVWYDTFDTDTSSEYTDAGSGTWTWDTGNSSLKWGVDEGLAILTKDDIDLDDFAIKYRAKDDDIGCYLGAYLRGDGTDQNYYWCDIYTGGINNERWRKVVSGSISTIVSDTNPVYNQGSWQTIEFRLDGINGEMLVNGSQLFTDTDSSLQNGSFGFRTYNGGSPDRYTYYDWVYVRNYALNEPTVSSTGSWEQAGVINNSISQTSPTDEATETEWEIDFNYTVTYYDTPKNASIRIYNNTDNSLITTIWNTTALINGSSNNQETYTFSENQSYLWDCVYYNNSGTSWVTDSNYTLTVDVAIPLSGYGYRKKVTLQENNGSALTDYQVNFTLDYSSSSDSGYTIGMDSKCQTDFGDIRFTGSDGETDLDYWLETTHTGDNATVWVEVPSLSASSTTDIYLYCGTSGTSSTTSNITNTFPEGNEMNDLTEFDNQFSKTSGDDRELDSSTYARTMIKLPDTNASIGTEYNGGVTPPTSGKYVYCVWWATDTSGYTRIKQENGTGNRLWYIGDANGPWRLSTTTSYDFGTDEQNTLLYTQVICDADNRQVLNVDMGDGDTYSTDRTWNYSGHPDNLEFYALGTGGTGNTWIGSFYYRKYVEANPTVSSTENWEQVEVINSISQTSPTDEATETELTTIGFNTTITYYDTPKNTSLIIYNSSDNSLVSTEWNTTAIINGTSINYYAYTFTSEGTYLWGARYYNTSGNSWTTGSNYTLTVDIPPRYRNVGDNSSSTINVGENIELYAEAYDSIGLDYGWLSTNETGSWSNHTSTTITGENETWTRYENNPIVTEGTYAFAVIKTNGTWYALHPTGNPDGDLNLFNSTDGYSWQKQADAVIEGTGTYPLLRTPNLWEENGEYHCIFGGTTGGGITHMFYATSSNLEDWTWENSGSPVLSPGDVWGSEVEPWGLIKVDSTYYMWYNDLGSGSDRDTGLATSTNLIDWSGDANNPIFTGGRFCGCVFKHGSYYYMVLPHYTVGSNYAEFELYKDSSPTFYSGSREFIGVKLETGEEGTWEDHDMDTTWVYTDNIYRNTTTDTDGEFWLYYGADDGDTNMSVGMAIEPSWDAAVGIGQNLTDFADAANTWTWANYTWSNSSITTNTTISWRIYFNDTYGNENVTETQTFTVVSTSATGWTGIINTVTNPNKINGVSLTLVAKVNKVE